MRLVIIGYGASARTFAQRAAPRLRHLAVSTRSDAKVIALRASNTSISGFSAHRFDAETVDPALCAAIEDATHLLISAPPAATGDPALRHLATSLHAAHQLRQIFYLSTIGVYGDHGGAWVDETTPPNPVSARSRQRLAAEAAWQAFARDRAIDLGIFRLAGIYGPGRSAIDTLKAGTARRIVKPGQVFNRIHVEDIAGVLDAALDHPGPLGIVNVCDDEPTPAQDVVAYAARLLGVEPPPEIPFETADLTPMARGFYGENKRVSNARIKDILGYALQYPCYREGLAQIVRAAQDTAWRPASAP